MSNVPEQLENAVVVVVGGSSGFGRGAALELGKRGAKVVVAARRTELIQEVASEIASGGGQAIAVTADVSIDTDVQSLARQAVEAYGRIDVWINNVGVGPSVISGKFRLKCMRGSWR